MMDGDTCRAGTEKNARSEGSEHNKHESSGRKIRWHGILQARTQCQEEQLCSEK